MFNLLLKRIKSLVQKKPLQQNNIIVNNIDKNEQEKVAAEIVDSCCSKFTFFIREDGEFAITSEFFRDGEEVIDVSSMILHMINSGLLAEYFVESLKMWSQNADDPKFILEIIKRWKVLYDEDTNMDKKSNKKFKLAVDPSDVFGLKSLKG